MKQFQWVSLIVVGGLSLLVIVTAAYYGDWLGASLPVLGSGHITVRQGDISVLPLNASPQTRQVKICTKESTIILGRSNVNVDGCRTLKNDVAPGVKHVAVIIPNDQPLGPAVAIARIRNDDGSLRPPSATDEEITLLIAPPRKTVVF